MYKERFYRDWLKKEDLYKVWVAIEESDILVATSKKIDEKLIHIKVEELRGQIKNYIKRDRRFLTSLVPIECFEDAPPIVKDMCSRAKLCEVGPFAGVAGAIAQYLGRDLLRYSPEVIIENGGDLFLKITRERKVGIVFFRAGAEQILRAKIAPQNTPLGISSSSSKVGHSLSLGNVDLACVFAEDSILSDICATLFGNSVKKKKDIPQAFRRLKSIPGVRAGILVFEGDVSLWGDLEIV